jgi:hypothetical protein
MSCFLLVLLVRGDADWSRSLAWTMYGLAAASFLLGLVGLIWAVLEPSTMPRRVTMFVLSLPPVLVSIGFGAVLFVLITSDLS